MKRIDLVPGKTHRSGGSSNDNMASDFSTPQSHIPDSIPTLAQCWFNVVHYNGPWTAYNVGPV